MTEQLSGNTGQLDEDRLAEIEAKFQEALDAVPPGAIYTDPGTGETFNVTKPYTHTNLTREDVQHLITELKAYRSVWGMRRNAEDFEQLRTDIENLHAELKAAQTRIADLEALVRRMDDEKGISDLNKRVDSYIIRIAELMHDKGYQFPAVGEI